MVGVSEKKPPTPREKEAARLGHCVVCRCEAFEPNGRVDGFSMCVCNHTQWGHKP